MSRRELEIRVGGTWLSSVAPWGNPVVTHRWPKGNWALSWAMDVSPDWTHPAITTGALVEAFSGPSRIWAGSLLEPDQSDGTFIAEGLCRGLEEMAALDGSVFTNDPNKAIFYAYHRGEVGSRVGAVDTFALVSTIPTEPRFINELMDLWSAETGISWFVDRNFTIWKGVEPTAPRWWIAPGVATLGVASDEYVTAWHGKYVNAATSSTASVSASSDAPSPRERLVDFTGRGPISTTKAQALVNNLLAKTGPQTGWTNGFSIGEHQITNRGGGRASLALVKAGDMVRLQGLRDQRTGSAHTDVVIGESVWDVDAREITLNPVGLAERNITSIVEAAGGRLSL